MKPRFQTFLRRLLLFGCIISAAVYLLSCIALYVDPRRFMPFTFLALLFPYLLCTMIISVVLIFFLYKKYVWTFIIVLLCGFISIKNVIGFHLPHTPEEKKLPGNIRLLSWNVDEFLDSRIDADVPGNARRKVLDFIKQTNADVLCLQDFRDYENVKDVYSNLLYIKDTLNYPYYYFSKDEEYNVDEGKVAYGVIIFSRYPIISEGKVKYPEPGYEHLEFADLQVGKDAVRFYNTHLASMSLYSAERQKGSGYSFSQDNELFINKDIVKRLRDFDIIHAEQARVIKSELNTCNKPFVFCADLNSVPSSYVYRKISKGLNDAFLSNGFGFGSTYDATTPTLRIDVTLYSDQLKVNGYSCLKLKASDHFPGVSDIEIK